MEPRPHSDASRGVLRRRKSDQLQRFLDLDQEWFCELMGRLRFNPIKFFGKSNLNWNGQFQ